jgi:hypothetical protein
MILKKQYYDIDNELIIGAVLLPSGIGNMGKKNQLSEPNQNHNHSVLSLLSVGALLSGWLSDYYIIKGKRSRGGSWLPEDRLRAALPSIGILTSLSVLGYSLTTEYVRGRTGIFLNLIWLFINGVGVLSIFIRDY